MSDMTSKWKAWKYELKKSSYEPSLTINEIVASQTDDKVNKDQFKVETEKKKKNRLESKDPHFTGTKSFARLTYEETQKNDGIRPSRGTIYCMTRTRKDGSVVNAEAAEVVEKLKTIMDSSSSNTQGISIDWTNDDLSKVKRRENRGRVRCVGRKVCVTKDRRSQCSQDPQVPVLKARIDELQDGLLSLAAIIKENIPQANLPTIIAGINMQVDDACSVRNPVSNGNPKSTGASRYHNPGSNSRI